MTIYVVRHAEAFSDKITKKWIEASKEKWRDIWMMLEWIKDEVLILTSPKNRAIETAENIKIWLQNEDIKIKQLDSLNDTYPDASLRVLIDIMELPKYPILVLVTHANYMYEVARVLWYSWWKLPDEVYLEDYEVELKEYKPIFKKYRV